MHTYYYINSDIFYIDNIFYRESELVELISHSILIIEMPRYAKFCVLISVKDKSQGLILTVILTLTVLLNQVSFKEQLIFVERLF